MVILDQGNNPGLWCRWFVIQGTVRPGRIVVLDPLIHQHLGFFDSIEDFSV